MPKALPRDTEKSAITYAYQSGMSMLKISQIVNCSQTTITEKLKKWGVKIESNRRVDIDPETMITILDRLKDIDFKADAPPVCTKCTKPYFWQHQRQRWFCCTCGGVQ